MNHATIATLFAAALAVLSPAAHAHDDAYLDKTVAPNGGQLRQAGIYHLELVTAKDAKGSAPAPVVIHVTDHAGTAVPTKGATGSATILTGKAKVSVPLAAAGDNRLEGRAAYAVAADTKVIVKIDFPGGKSEQARFTPGAVARAH